MTILEEVYIRTEFLQARFPQFQQVFIKFGEGIVKKYLSNVFSLIAILLLIGSPVLSPALSNETDEKIMRFVTAAPLESDLARLTNLTLTEAFRRLGYRYEVISLPQKRCIFLMKTGQVDGDATRVYAFNKNNKHPYYVRVGESHAKIFWSVFMTDPDVQINAWDDLKKGGYRVGYLAGVKYSEQNLNGLIDKDKLIPQTSSNRNGLRQLQRGRIDAYVYADGARAKNDLATEELENSGIVLAGHVDHKDMYPYLQKKHEALADDLTKKIREIKTEGLFDIFKEQVFGEKTHFIQALQ